MNTSKLRNIAFSLLILLLASLAFFLFSNQTIKNYGLTFIVASLVYLLFLFFLKKVSISRMELMLIIVLLFAVKISFLFTTPVGSDDYYRYLWDGKVQANGINPYSFAPQDSVLKTLHSELLPAQVSYPKIKTIYFPLCQWLFAVSYLISGENAIVFKLIYLIADLAILFFLYSLLKYFSISEKYLLVYATLPVVVFQFYIDAHIDIVGAALLIGSLRFYLFNKKSLSYLLLGLSLSIKPTGILLIPFYFQNEDEITAKLKSILIPPMTFVITFLPYVFSATPLETLINYSTNWTFNGMIYNALKLIIADNLIIRICCGLIFTITLFILYNSKIELINKIFISIFLLILFSPVAHPWYLIWFAVLLPLVRSWSGIYFVSAISLTSFTIITYQLTGIWREYEWVLLAQYLPVALIFFYELRHKKFFGNLIVNS